MHATIRLSVFVLLGACHSSSGGQQVDSGPFDGKGADSASSDAAQPDANPSAPTCVIDMPGSGTSTAFDVPVALKATATDPQDGVLTGASVVWRSSLSVAPLGSGDMISTMLPPGSNVITCTATDSTSLTGMATVTVVSKSPFAQINHPGNNETRPAAQAVPFVGVGRDLEDGALMGASLAWTSSIDGSIGTGGQFNRVLSAGAHTITLKVTDSAGNADTASITLTMTP